MCHAGQYNKYRMKWSSLQLVRICVLQQLLMFTETAAACHKNIYSHPYREKTDLNWMMMKTTEEGIKELHYMKCFRRLSTTKQSFAACFVFMLL